MENNQIVNKIHKDIKKNGYSKIDNFLDKSIFEELRKLLISKSNELNNKNFSLDSSEKIFLLEQILNNNIFNNVYNKLLNYSNIPECNEKFYVIGLREGKQIDKSILYHFDAYYLTILFPILIPEGKNNGKLHIFPRWRKIQKFELINFIQKLVVQNPLIRKIFNFNFFKKILNMKEIELDTNYIYFFEGYRSIHGVGNHDEGLRSTAVFHFHNPHKGKFFNELVKKKHKIDREKITKKN